MALSASQSFATAAESVTYATPRGWTDWLAADEAVQEARLIEATDFIVATYRWPGTLADSSQVLPFPRIGLYDGEGRYITGTPDKLKAATIEAARLALSGALLGGEVSTSVKREKIGPIETEYATATRTEDRRDRLAYVSALLRSIGALGGSSTINVMLRKA